MDFASLIITPVVESLLVPVKQQLGFLVYSSKYVGDMREKVIELAGAADDMRTQQASYEVNRKVVPHRVPGWLENVTKLNERAERISTIGVGCFNIKTKYKAGKQSCVIFKDIDRLMKEKAEMVWTNEIVPLGMVSPPRPSTFTAVKEDDQNENIESRSLIFKDALKFLEPNNTKTQKMALCGMAGVGKTTMLEQLEKVARGKKMFKCVVKVVVKQKWSSTDVQQSVAEYTGGPLSETNEDTRAAALEERFKKISKEGKVKILVLLDDVWKGFKLKVIGLAGPLPNGLKLLLTSREETVCTQMGVESSSIFRIDVLEETEAKKLFWETTGLGSESNGEPDLHQIGEDIVKRCGRLPIAIVTIACTLKDNMQKDEWKDALSRLQNKQSDDYNIKAIFEISYMNLKDSDLKDFFLLCGLFPEDHDISIEDLLRCGWGLKFFNGVHSIAEARSRVNTCANSLIRSNLLTQSDREGCVKMHDLVRDFVLSSLSKVKQASIVSHNNNVYGQLNEEEPYERILLRCDDMFEIPVDFSHPNLTLLILMGGYRELKFPEDFYTRMEKLEVVAYENVHKPLLPRYSTNLRSLSLHGCSLGNVDISFLGDLINLELLNIAYCGINKLPSMIGKLKRLKLLDITGCEADLSIDDGVLQNLVKLEELYMGHCQQKAIMFTDANCDELKMLSNKLSALEVEFFENNAQPKYMSFGQLERFRISIGCVFERIPLMELSDNDRKVYLFKNTLRLVSNRSELLESKINELFRKTEILYLEVSDINHLEDVVYPHPHPQHSFYNLKALEVSNCAGLTHLFTISMAKGFTKLESLKIRSCPVLKSVVNGEKNKPGVITFSMLKFLYLDDLPELVSLCDPVIVMELHQLVELHLGELQKISNIFSVDYNNMSTQQPLLNKKVVIPKLKTLAIHSMKNLKEIWPCEVTCNEDVDNISMLREIEVYDCHSLVNLFPSNPMRILSHLEVLTVKECGSIEVLFNIDLGKSGQLSSCGLRTIHLSDCESFREVWRVKDAGNNNPDLLIRSFQAVEYITISRCERFKHIVTPTTANFDMTALKDINISECGEHGERNYNPVNSSQEQEINTIVSEAISKVADNTSIFSFQSDHIANNFHHLREIRCSSFQGVEAVFEIEISSKRDKMSATQQQPLLLVPNLEELELVKMYTLTHVWKCNNWNAFFTYPIHQPQSSSLQNLTTITLVECKSIKYMFSPLMVKLLSNVKKVNISRCDGMEEVVSGRDDELMGTSTSAHTTTTLFPALGVLELSCLQNLKHIGGGFAMGSAIVTHNQSEFPQVDAVSWSLCQHSSEILIDGCDALSSVVPSYAAGQMSKLQVLSIQHCASMMEVFATKETNNNHVIVVHKFQNLRVLQINGCDRLENVFTFSTLESLEKLETLTISGCKEMKVVVREEDGEHTPKNVVFPHLKSIELYGLPNLEGFFLGMDIDFQWPVLDCVIINRCPQIMAFTSGRSTAPKLKYIETELGKHNPEHGLNIWLHQTPPPSLDGISSGLPISDGKPLSYHNLAEIELRRARELKKIIPSSELQRMQNLETIQAKGCHGLEEVFEVALEATTHESQTITKIPKLRDVDLHNMSRMKYLWKSNQSTMLEFPNLTRISLSGCTRLEHVFTYSMIGFVMQLQELHIRWCGDMKAIVKEDKDHDAKVSNEIELPCLKSLKLEYLSGLEGFCLGKVDFALPCLDTLVINNCSRVTCFTEGRAVTPILRVVDTSFGSFSVGEDINTFIKANKSTVGNVSRGSEEDQE